MRIEQPSVFLEAITPDAARLIERAGRTCYKSEGKIGTGTASQFIKMIMARGHLSVLEHASATFRIVCDRGIGNEIVRHRICSFSQESTRYCNFAKEKFGTEISVIKPPDLTESQERDWRDLCEHAERCYLKMISEGQAPEIARSVLPLCLKTEIVWTANFREWLWVCLLRTAPRAHRQMIPLARLIRASLASECPEVFAQS